MFVGKVRRDYIAWEDDDKVSSSSDVEVFSNVTSLWGSIYHFITYLLIKIFKDFIFYENHNEARQGIKKIASQRRVILSLYVKVLELEEELQTLQGSYEKSQKEIIGVKIRFLKVELFEHLRKTTLLLTDSDLKPPIVNIFSWNT